MLKDYIASSNLSCYTVGDGLAFLYFPWELCRKVWSTKLLEQPSKEIKRPSNVVDNFPDDPAIKRLVGTCDLSVVASLGT